jgi:hypothetical protein
LAARRAPAALCRAVERCSAGDHARAPRSSTHGTLAVFPGGATGLLVMRPASALRCVAANPGVAVGPAMLPGRAALVALRLVHSRTAFPAAPAAVTAAVTAAAKLRAAAVTAAASLSAACPGTAAPAHAAAVAMIAVAASASGAAGAAPAFVLAAPAAVSLTTAASAALAAGTSHDRRGHGQGQGRGARRQGGLRDKPAHQESPCGRNARHLR